MIRNLYKFFWVLCLIGGLGLFSGSAQAAEEGDALKLTPKQQELWDKTHAELIRIYKEKHLVPRPVPLERINAIRVPLDIARTKEGPLPWDVRMLLSFDRNLILAGHYWNEQPLLKDFTKLDKYKRHIFVPDGLIDIFRWYPFNLFEDSEFPLTEDEARKILLENSAELPMVWSMPQLGGDELPQFWAVLPEDECTVVLHFDYDDMPVFYVRNTSLFSYVLEYIAEQPELDYVPDTRTDGSRLWGVEEDQRILALVKPSLDQLNAALDAVLYID